MSEQPSELSLVRSELSLVRIELLSNILLHCVILHSNTHYSSGIIIVLAFHVR
jgi:hypothetical protein